MGILCIFRKFVGFFFFIVVYEMIVCNKLVVFLLMEFEKVCLVKFLVIV